MQIVIFVAYSFFYLTLGKAEKIISVPLSAMMTIAKKQVEFSCETCGSKFTVKLSKSAQSKTRYCSLKCRNEGFNGENSPLYTRVMKFCRHCGEEFFAKRSEPGNFCSKTCKYDSQKCERPQDSKSFYTLSFWHKLRKECFDRDGGSCQRCGTKERQLHAHHIVPRRKNGPDELFNLISLCNSCHRIVEHETAY